MAFENTCPTTSMATDTPQLLLLTSTRNHCRTHRCTHSNERLLMSPCPDRRREPATIPNAIVTVLTLGWNWGCSVPPASRCQGLVVADHLVRAEPKLALSQCFRARHDIGEVIASHRIAHIRNVCILHQHTNALRIERSHNTCSAHREIAQHLLCAPRDRATLAPLPCCYRVAFSWTHCCVLWSWWATHSLPTEVGTGVLWVLTGTHPCDDPPRQDGEPSERQLLLACLLVRWLLLSWLIVAVRLVYLTPLLDRCCQCRAITRWHVHPSAPSWQHSPSILHGGHVATALQAELSLRSTLAPRTPCVTIKDLLLRHRLSPSITHCRTPFQCISHTEAQQEPHWPWFFTGANIPTLLSDQSQSLGRSLMPPS